MITSLKTGGIKKFNTKINTPTQKFRCISTAPDTFVITSQTCHTSSNVFFHFFQNLIKTCSGLLLLFSSKNKTEENKTEENKAEENKAEENKAEENKTEVNKAEENRAEENKAEENRAEENKIEENKTEENKIEENKTEENKTEENKAEENRAEETHFLSCSKKSETKKENKTEMEKSNPKHSNFRKGDVVCNRTSESNRTRTTETVKANKINIPTILSNDPKEFIKPMLDELENNLNNVTEEEERRTIIRHFLAQPKILNRLAASRNPKMKTYFDQQAQNDVENVWEVCTLGDNNLNNFVAQVRNKFIEKLKITSKIDFADSTLPDSCLGKCEPKRDGSYTITINNNITRKKRYITTYHELVHVRQNELVKMVLEGNIEQVRELDQKEQIRCLSALLAMCQYDCQFVNGCNPDYTIQLSDYSVLNNEVEAHTYDNILSEKLEPYQDS